MKLHLTWATEWKGERLGILEMRRHYSNYFKGISNIKEYRNQLVNLDSKDEILKILEKIREKL